MIFWKFNGRAMLLISEYFTGILHTAYAFFFLYPQSQYGPPEAIVYSRTKFVTPPASLMV